MLPEKELRVAQLAHIGRQPQIQEEGIIPAIESSHALAGALKLGREAQANGEEPPTILVSLSGRGDKDVETAMTYFGISGKGEQR